MAERIDTEKFLTEPKYAVNMDSGSNDTDRCGEIMWENHQLLCCFDVRCII